LHQLNGQPPNLSHSDESIFHFDEIEELRLSLMEEDIMPARPSSDLCTFLTWLAFEETARQLVQEILAN